MSRSSLSAPPSLENLLIQDEPTQKTNGHPLRNLLPLSIWDSFHIKSTDFNTTIAKAEMILPQNGSKFDQMLYKASTLRVRQLEASKQLIGCHMYKCLKGEYNLVMELCPEKPRDHHHEFHIFHRVCERFNQRRFNFVQLRPTETLLKLTDDNKGSHSIIMTTRTKNFRPIFVPFIGDCLPQALTEKALKVATSVLLLSKCAQFALGFNSLMAGCEVNHLHFETFTCPYTSGLIKAKTKPIGKTLYSLENWIVPGFVVQVENYETDKFCRLCERAAHCLANMNQPFGAVLCRAPNLQRGQQLELTAYLFPRQPVATLQAHRSLRPTASDMRGIVSIYSQGDMYDIQESQIVRCFQDSIRIDAVKFTKLTKELQSVCLTEPDIS